MRLTPLSAALAAMLGAMLGGCTNLHVMSHVPLSTMSRLSSMTLADVDPDQLRVAARMPLSLEPRPLGVRVSIDIREGSRPPWTEAFVLEPATEPAEQSEVAAYRRAGAQVSIFCLTRTDAIRLRGVLAELARRSGPPRITIEAAVDACHRAPLGTAPLPTTTLLRTNGSGYFVLAEDLDLRRVLSSREIAEKIPACPR